MNDRYTAEEFTMQIVDRVIDPSFCRRAPEPEPATSSFATPPFGGSRDRIGNALFETFGDPDTGAACTGTGDQPCGATPGSFARLATFGAFLTQAAVWLGGLGSWLTATFGSETPSAARSPLG